MGSSYGSFAIAHPGVSTMWQAGLSQVSRCSSIQRSAASRVSGSEWAAHVPQLASNSHPSKTRVKSIGQSPPAGPAGAPPARRALQVGLSPSQSGFVNLGAIQPFDDDLTENCLQSVDDDLGRRFSALTSCQLDSLQVIRLEVQRMPASTLAIANLSKSGRRLSGLDSASLEGVVERRRSHRVEIAVIEGRLHEDLVNELNWKFDGETHGCFSTITPSRGHDPRSQSWSKYTDVQKVLTC